MTYVDKVKHQKKFHYENRIKRLNKKYNYDEFDEHEFHKTRKSSTKPHLLKAIGRVALSLNDKEPESINVDDLDDVCFILMNSYKDLKHHNLGVGPLNDGEMIAVNFHRRGYKVFYLFNSTKDKFLQFAQFFIKNTQKQLVIFYTGRAAKTGTHHSAIMFPEGLLEPNQLGQAFKDVGEIHSNVVLITDCCTGGSVWSIEEIMKNYGEKACPNIMTLAVRKNASNMKKFDKTHGMFTYYLCKILNEKPNISPNGLVERINPPLSRFDECLLYHETLKELNRRPIF